MTNKIIPLRSSKPKLVEQEIRRGFSATELEQPPPLRYYVDGMLVEGLTLLAGRPKKGKSWMVLGMACDISEGVPTLGDLDTRASSVIVYALEDNKRRLYRRLTTVMGTSDKSKWPTSVTFFNDLNATDCGGLDQIRADVRQHRAKVVFIDTLSKIRPRPEKGLDPYQQDYNAIAELHALAHELKICLVVVYHTKKGFTDDPQELIMGSTGIVAAVDSWFVLKVTPDVSELHGGGRDIESVEWSMLHGAKARWTVIGDANEERKSDHRKKIMRVLRKHGGEMATRDIAAAVDREVDPTKVLLSNMAKAGDIIRTRHGHYTHKGITSLLSSGTTK